MKCPDGLVLSITSAAIAISKQLTTEEMNLLAAVAMQFGDTLTTLATASESKSG